MEFAEQVTDTKYVTFKRERFEEWLGFVRSFLGTYEVTQIETWLDEMRLHDAVVIRRQDLFAAPALSTYGDCIALVARTTPDEALQKRLTGIADYFHQQAMVAADEGFKFPD